MRHSFFFAWTTCARPQPRQSFRGSKPSIVTQLLRGRGFEVEQRDDGPLDDLSPEYVVWIWGCANWFPRAMRSLVKRPAEARPATVLWHVEPFPLPRDSGQRWPRPTARDLAKIVLRDSLASDVYSNYFTLRRLIARGIPDVLAVTSGERAAFFAERGLDAFVALFGYRKDYGATEDAAACVHSTFRRHKASF